MEIGTLFIAVKGLLGLTLYIELRVGKQGNT
jgi:hypothetical protein